jgi:pimeloyl-ACP methyl ester carboxylesterase
MRESREFSVDIGDIELAVVEWPGAGDPILLLHATGFHSRCWTQVVKSLPGRQIYAVDLRFHGKSGKGDTVDWILAAQDICILIKELGLTGLTGVGHSIGGFLITRIAAQLPAHFKQLLLIDPVIFARENYASFTEMAANSTPADLPVSRRKNRWQDADEMFQRFQDRAPFDSWQPAVLRDYCDYALHPSDEEGWMQLACDPLHEAAHYLNQAGNDVILGDLGDLQAPVTLLRALEAESSLTEMLGSPTWPGVAGLIPVVRDIYLPDMNHFIPMQNPQLVADYITEACDGKWPASDAERAAALI